MGLTPEGKPGPACFGLGLMSVPLPDGTALWGKTGHGRLLLAVVAPTSE
ncbi:hypothetical protein ABT150_30440 [Streptomyces mirabilis]